jgi:hypothetical protein
MPKHELDPEDPLEAVAVALPSDEDTLIPMAECFIEEFMRMGYSPEQIAGLFANPLYAGPLLVTRRHGTAFVNQLIAETFARWGRAPGCHPERPAEALSREGEGSPSCRPPETAEILCCAQNDKPENSEVNHVPSL